MEFSRRKNLFVILIMTAILTSGISFALQDKTYFADQKAIISNNQSNILTGAINPNILSPSTPPEPRGIPLSNPPEIIKAVYVTGYSAGNKKYLDYLSGLFKSTEINAVVIDIKDYSGLVSYNSDASDLSSTNFERKEDGGVVEQKNSSKLVGDELKKYNLCNNAIPNIDALVNFFHSQNIYVIGRIAVFEDPAFSKSRPDLAVYNKSKTTHSAGSGQADLSQPILWQDNHGLSWLDPASKDVWDYNISLAKDAFSHGFDEMNFDYVRFPSDGKTENMGFSVWDQKKPKSEVIKEFFNYTRANLPDEKISVDLFGQTTVNTDDMGIGQIIENAFENFDYVSPMVYPSHYANEFIGFANPAEHPYEVIKYSMSNALNREKSFLEQKQDLAMKNSKAAESPAALAQVLTPAPVSAHLAKFRPWLQDFNMGADYTADMVKQEIKATQDSLGNDYNGFMLWNPFNIYTEDAIQKTGQ